MELHIITACAVLLAIEPVRKLAREIRNWLDRREAHKLYLRSER
jgi:hypothetical protein